MSVNYHIKAWGGLREVLENTSTIPPKEAVTLLHLMTEIKKKDNVSYEKAWNTLRKIIEDNEIIPHDSAITILKTMVEIQKHYQIK